MWRDKYDDLNMHQHKAASELDLTKQHLAKAQERCDLLSMQVEQQERDL